MLLNPSSRKEILVEGPGLSAIQQIELLHCICAAVQYRKWLASATAGCKVHASHLIPRHVLDFNQSILIFSNQRLLLLSTGT